MSRTASMTAGGTAGHGRRRQHRPCGHSDKFSPGSHGTNPLPHRSGKLCLVSSQGRRRNPPGSAGRSGHHRVARPVLAPAPPNALFAEMLRAARELLALRSPLDAELIVSEMLGTWWGQRAPQASGHRNADLEGLIGEGLVDYAAQHPSPAALALLSGIACLG